MKDIHHLSSSIALHQSFHGTCQLSHTVAWFHSMPNNILADNFCTQSGEQYRPGLIPKKQTGCKQNYFVGMLRDFFSVWTRGRPSQEVWKKNKQIISHILFSSVPVVIEILYICICKVEHSKGKNTNFVSVDITMHMNAKALNNTFK